MLMNLCLISILIGSIRAMEALVSQAYGKGDTELMSAYMNRGRMILICLFIPLAVILWYTESVLLFLHQDHEVAHYAGIYSRICIPGMFF